jgi:dTDP-4-dehydrorhamnose reductase
MNKVLVFGGRGQLGSCLKAVAQSRSYAGLSFPEGEHGDILNVTGLEALFQSEKPAYVINCAAYTAVDKAEDEIGPARQVNRDGAENLARLCNKHGATLIHVSTDFVFEGNLPQLLTEDMDTNPGNVYGLTKLEGEQAIALSLERFFILRTSWLYSEHGNNFVKTMLRLAAERDELKIIADQVGTPTYAIDLANAIIDLINSNSEAYGVYHYSNEGVASWYDFAKAVFDLNKSEVKLFPLTTSEFPTKATRPAFSVMSKNKIKKTFGMEIPYWRDSLAICIANLKNATT